MMHKLLLKNAQFVTSAPDTAHLSQYNLAEFAFLGRSNVGKSSLINLVANQKKLAHTSRTPGRTRLLNYFKATLQNETDVDIGIVDLPGFGYAKMSHTEKAKLTEMLSEYINLRPAICGIFHLVDIRRDPEPDDVALSQQLRALERGYSLVVTKSDKVVKSKRKITLSKIAQAYGLESHQVILTSVSEKFGQEAIWEQMWTLASPK